jgi:hypothetical protein
MGLRLWQDSLRTLGKIPELRTSLQNTESGERTLLVRMYVYAGPLSPRADAALLGKGTRDCTEPEGSCQLMSAHACARSATP